MIHREGLMAGKRTTHRTTVSTASKKLYGVGEAKGRVKDVQKYEGARGQDVKRSSQAEREKKVKKG
jgi:hypothetical protein